MLEQILQTLRDVEGVQGAVIVDHVAEVVAARAHSVYDLSVLRQVARSVGNAADAVQLMQDDWDGLTAHFSDGKLLFRNLRIASQKSRRYILVVITDSTLNVAFLGVALRVAAAKLVTVLETYAAPVVSAVATQVGTGRIPLAEPAPPEQAKNGLSWSGTSQGSALGGSSVGGSSVVGSGVGVSDSASATYLTACTRALASHIGPLAKMLVKEAVRAVCGDRPFSRADGPALVAKLSAGITNKTDLATFQRVTRAL